MDEKNLGNAYWKDVLEPIFKHILYFRWQFCYQREDKGYFKSVF